MIEKKIKRELIKEFNLLPKIKKFGKPFKSPKNYAKWEDEVLTYYLKSFDPFSRDKVSNYCINVSLSLSQYKYPTYYVGKDLAIALWNTTSNLNISDLNVASPAALFMLPYETILTPEGDSLTSVSLTSPKQSSVLQEIYHHFGDGLMGCCGFIKNQIEKSYWYGSFNPSSFISQEEEKYEEFLLENQLIPQLVTNPTEKIFMRRFRTFMFNLMYALENNPELFSEQSSTTIKNKGFGYNSLNETKYRTPIWLGKHYKIRRKSSSGKQYSTKSPHFRKGHLRKQKYGKNKTKEKIVWIKPVLVNTD